MNNTPTYQSLFGPDGYYTVPDARSVLSPGAYLVELLKLVNNQIQNPNLKTRRPDIYNTLTLDEPNTDNELSKLSIVNSLLKNSLNNQDPNNLLETATYPFNLPYDPSLEAIRHYLAQNNLSLQELWKSFKQNNSIPITVYLETLGISQAQWSQYSTLPASGNLYQYYGYPSGTPDATVVTNLSTIQTFLTQTGLTQAELRELVYEDLNETEISKGILQNNFYINKGSSAPINIQGQTLANLTPTNVGNIECFVRLAKAIGWSFTDLDWALNTIGTIIITTSNNAPAINDAALPYLAWIQQQVKQNGLTVNQCCGFLGNIKNFGLKSGTTFYDSIFNNPQNPLLPAVPSGSSKLTWTILQSGGSAASNDQQIENALSAALQLNQKDLLKVAVNISDVNESDNILTLLISSNPQATPQPIQPQIDLALLYRMSLLPIITGNTIDSIFSACNLLWQQNADTNYLKNLMSTSSTSAIPTTDEISDFFSWLDASPLKLGQLEFILKGTSSNPAVQNSIVSTDAVQNFLQQLQSSTELLTSATLYKAIHSNVLQLVNTIINQTPETSGNSSTVTSVGQYTPSLEELCRSIIFDASTNSNTGSAPNENTISSSIYQQLIRLNIIDENGIVNSIPDFSELFCREVTSIIVQSIYNALSSTDQANFNVDSVFMFNETNTPPNAESVNNLSNYDVTAMASACNGDTTTYYAGTATNGLWSSTDGLLWTPIIALSNYSITAIEVLEPITISGTSQATICVGTIANGLWTSTDGINWSPITHFSNDGISLITCFGIILYAGTFNSGLWTSVDGLNWSQISSFPVNTTITSIEGNLIPEVSCLGPNIPGFCFAGTTNNGLYGYNYNGAIGWNPVSGFLSNVSVQSICTDDGTNWFIGTSNGLYYGDNADSTSPISWSLVTNSILSSANITNVYYTENDGSDNQPWFYVTTSNEAYYLGPITSSPIPDLSWASVPFSETISQINCVQFQNTATNFGTDNGLYSVNMGTEINLNISNCEILCLGPNISNFIFAGTDQGLYCCDKVNGWELVTETTNNNNPIIPNSIAVHCICTDYTSGNTTANWFFGTSQGLYYACLNSDNQTLSYQLVNDPNGVLTNESVSMVYYDGNAVWYAVTQSGIYYLDTSQSPCNYLEWNLISTSSIGTVNSIQFQNGQTYIATSQGLYSTSNGTNLAIASNIFIGTDTMGLWTTTDGINWSQTNNLQEYSITSIVSFYANDDYVYFAGTSVTGLWTSTDGVNWTQPIDLQDYDITSIISFGTMLVAGTSANGLWTSTDGNSWINLNSTNNNFPENAKINYITTNQSTIYVGTDANGLLTSTDGNSWTPINLSSSTTTTYAVDALFTVNQLIYVSINQTGSPIKQLLESTSDHLVNYLKVVHDKQTKVLSHCLATLYKTNPAIAEIIYTWGDINLKTLSGSLESENLLSLLLSLTPSDAVPLLQELQQTAMSIQSLSLSTAEARYFFTGSSDSQNYPISLCSIQEIAAFKKMVKTAGDAQNNLLKLIQNLDGQKWINSLSSICNWDTNELNALCGAAYLNVNTPSLSGILLLNTYFNTAESLGIKASVVFELVQWVQSTASSYSTTYFANILWGGLQAQLKEDPTTLTRIQNKNNEKLRNHLVPLVINTLSSQSPNLLSNYGNTPRGLYAYLLIDVEVSGVVQTSNVREAISAVQLYINRCLNQLETESPLVQGSTLPTLWTWMQSYRMWQANMEVFLNPENYIEPELRVDKTDLFTQAEQALKQADLTNPESIETIFGNYMNGFETIGNLQIISCAANTYQAEDAEGSQNFKELCMIGVGPAGNGQYYYRLSVFRESTTEEQYVPYDWGQWQKINITLNTIEYQPGQYGIPNPVFAFGRWYLFWMEQQKGNSSSNLEISNLSKIKYNYYTGIIQCSYLDFNQNWGVPQCIQKIELQNTPLIPTTVNDTQSATTTVSYQISTAQDAEVLITEINENQLQFNVLGEYYGYQPSSTNDFSGIGICIQSLNQQTYVGKSNAIYSVTGSTPSLLNTTPLISLGTEILCFGPNSTFYFMGTSMGLFGYNYNDVNGWAQITDFPTNVSVQAICTDDGTNWYVGTSNGLYYGNNAGSAPISWNLVTNGIPPSANITNVYYTKIDPNDSSPWFYAATSNDAYYLGPITSSPITDQSWASVQFPIAITQINCVQFQKTSTNFGTDSGLYSANQGVVNSSNISNCDIHCFGPNTNDIWLAGTNQGLYWYKGSGWVQLANIPNTVSVQSICTDGLNTWLFGTSQGLYYGTWDGTSLYINLVNLASENISMVYYDGNMNWYAGNSNMLYTTTTTTLSENWVLVQLTVQILTSITPTTVYNTGTSLSILNEPNWFIINGSNNDQYLNISYPPGGSPTNYNVYRLNSTAIPALGALLNGPNGLNQLLSTSAQQTSEATFANLVPNNTYIPLSNYPLNVIDFTNKNAMRMYYWELFFHLPFLIANELNLQQQFATAKLWYEYIFNPLVSSFPSGTQDQYTNDMYWCFLGLQQNNNTTLATELAQGELAELRSDLENAVELYASESKPFDPQAIAQLRPIAYQKALVMNYIGNLLNWGDMLYTQNTRTSINEAEMLYVLAYNLLGEQPQDLGNEALLIPGTPKLDSWQSVSVGSESSSITFTCLFEINQTLYAGTSNQNGFWFSTDEGNTWGVVGDGLFASNSINCINYFNMCLYVGTKNNGLWSSTDNGTNWTQVNANNFPISSDIVCINYFNNSLYVGTNDNGLWSFTDIGTNWTQVSTLPTQGSIAAITIINTTIYACLTYVDTVPAISFGLWRSADGNSWERITNGLPLNASLTCINYFNGSLYVGTAANSLYTSIDNGNTWTQASFDDSTNFTIKCINYFNNSLYVGTNGNGLWSFTDNGTNWTQVLNNDDFPTQGSIAAITIINSTIYACHSYVDTVGEQLSFGLWSSADGITWYCDPTLREYGVTFIQSTSAGFLAGTNNGLYLLRYQFGIPRNQQFLSYWTEVQQRIYNIRNGLSISGQTDNLPLFAPPINPMALVEAVASGESVAQLLQLQNPLIPYYRFETMIEKAKEFTATVVQLGQSILAALQAQDAQTLAELYNTNNGNILNLTQTARQDSLNAAQQTLQALQAGLASAKDRLSHYNNLISGGWLPGETAQVTLATTSIATLLPEEAIRIASIVGYSIPTIFGFSDGGFHPGSAIKEGAEAIDGVSNILNMSSNLAGTIAGFQRRAEDWNLQATLAQDDINQINYQILAAQYQQDLAQQEITLLQNQITQQQQVAAFYTSKFTNDQLYSWYTGQLSSLYFQAYHLAHDMALQAENAWNFEHIGLPFLNQQGSFIQPGYWNSLYQGLLSGASLQLDLLRMEKAYMDQNVRRMEITKTISLARLDPVALYNLIQTGSCQFELTEYDFAWDYPEHYCRKIKTIAVSIPMVVGPYQDIHATLTQTTNRLINSDGSDGINAVQYLLNPTTSLSGTNTALQTNLIPNQQVALSQGVNDTGMFELNFNDARYLPFEGTGALSSWQLDLPTDTNFINYESISDVIIEMKYTALSASSAYKQAVTTARGPYSGYRIISLAQECASAWNGFIESGTSMQFTVTASKWRGVGSAATITINTIWLCALGNSIPNLSLTFNPVSFSTTEVTFQTLSANNLISQGDIPSGGITGFPTSAQNIQLSTGITTPVLSGLQNLVIIIEYTVS